MGTAKIIIHCKALAAFLVVSCMICSALADERPLDLNAVKDFVCVPSGSANNFLGLLFAQLEINGGIELGNLSIDLKSRIRALKNQNDNDDDYDSVVVIGYKDEKGVEKSCAIPKRELCAKPGDPVYLNEFIGEKVSIRDALNKYCAVNKQLTWRMSNDVVNVSYKGLRKSKRNPLDLLVPKIVFEQGASLDSCLYDLHDALQDKLENAKVSFTFPESQKVLPDYLDAGDTTRLSRGRVFEKKTMREILNSLVKPYHNVVWIATQYERKDGSILYYIFFGSWRPLLVQLKHKPEFWLDLLEKSTEYGEEVEYRGTSFPEPSECKTWLYICYRRNPEAVIKAIEAKLQQTKDDEIKEMLEMVKEYLPKKFGDYAYEVIEIEY